MSISFICSWSFPEAFQIKVSIPQYNKICKSTPICVSLSPKSWPLCRHVVLRGKMMIGLCTWLAVGSIHFLRNPPHDSRSFYIVFFFFARICNLLKNTHRLDLSSISLRLGKLKNVLSVSLTRSLLYKNITSQVFNSTVVKLVYLLQEFLTSYILTIWFLICEQIASLVLVFWQPN